MMKEISFDLQPIWQTKTFQIRSQQICQQLQQEKIHRVALWFEDALDFTCALLACLNANVKVLLPPNLLAENQQWIAQNADLFLSAENIHQYGILQKISNIIPLIDKQNQTEICLKTSGSSGNAKIITKTAQQMWAEAQTLADSLPFKRGADTLLLGSVSVQHLYGLTFRVFLALEMGWQLGREQLQYPEYLISASQHCSQAIWVSSPALLTHLNLDNADLTTAKIAGIISSGGALPEQVAENIRHKIAKPVIEIYGSTETGVIAFRDNCSLWQPFPNSTLGVNEQGALWVKSDWISKAEQTADAVELTDQGFKLLGRIDRIVKLGDKRVSLVKIEQDLLNHYWVKDCYIALHPEQQRPVAWIALNTKGIAEYKQQGRKAIIQHLRQFLSTYQEKFALPRFWRFSDTLPRNSQSKISRLDFEKICYANQDEINE